MQQHGGHHAARVSHSSAIHCSSDEFPTLAARAAECGRCCSRHLVSIFCPLEASGSPKRVNDIRASLRGRLTPPATFAQGRMQLKHVKVGERRGSLFGANNDLIMPRGACSEQIALCCAV